MTLNEFLMWLFGNGGNVIVVSWVCERWPWFQSLTPDKKKMAYFLFAAVISCVSYGIITYVPENIMQELTVWFGLLYGTFISVFFGEMFHKETKG